MWLSELCFGSDVGEQDTFLLDTVHSMIEDLASVRKSKKDQQAEWQKYNFESQAQYHIAIAITCLLHRLLQYAYVLLLTLLSRFGDAAVSMCGSEAHDHMDNALEKLSTNQTLETRYQVFKGDASLLHTSATPNCWLVQSCSTLRLHMWRI